MATPATQSKPWFSCCLSAAVEPEPQSTNHFVRKPDIPALQAKINTAASPDLQSQPEPRNSYQAHHYAGKFSHLHIDARIAANKAAHGLSKTDIDATDGKSLVTTKRHRKLDSQEVIDLRGALQRASITSGPKNDS